MHREDIKAEVRTRFGSLAAFERSHDLPPKSTSDFFRGRTSARVQTALANAIGSSGRKGGVDNYAPNPVSGKPA